MNKLREYVLAAPTLVLGGLAYVGLNWIPIVGPLAVGFIVGYLRRRGPKDGFRLGIYSGVLGFVGVIYLFKATGVLNLSGVSVLPSFLLFWIILLWNIVGILFAGVGGVLSSMLYHAQDFLEERFSRESRAREHEGGVTSFIICPNCGIGVKEGQRICPSCDGRI